MHLKSIHMAHAKCTRLLDLPAADLTPSGIAGDRDFILLDRHGVPVSSSKHACFLPLELHLVPAAGGEEDHLLLRYPDGRTVSAPCRLAREPQALDYLGMRRILVRAVLGEWSALLSAFSDREVTLVRCETTGEGVDVLPITLFTTASLALLEDKLGAPVDPRRFRANLVVSGGTPHVEDEWDGRLLAVGDAVLLIRTSVPRCIVTQLDPETGRNDLRTVPVLMGYREKVHLPDGLMPDYATPGFASYAQVVRPARIRTGDRVHLL